jgi:hypothetical protein
MKIVGRKQKSADGEPSTTNEMPQRDKRNKKPSKSTTPPKPSPSGSRFTRELDATTFTIFEVLADLGCFAWCPPPIKKAPAYRSLASECAVALKACIDYSSRPAELINVRAFREKELPLCIPASSPNQYANEYPYDVPQLASLHVALKNASVSGISDIDFVLGGSSLNYLATRSSASRDEHYIVYQIPETNVVCLKNHKKYLRDLSELGHQVEHILTSAPSADTTPSINIVEHLQLASIGGKYKALIAAEVDARTTGKQLVDCINEPVCKKPRRRDDDDDEVLVEIKSGKPQYYGTKTMFQMISSGSAALCRVEKDNHSRTVTGIRLQALSEVVSDALDSSQTTAVALETQIVKNLTTLHDFFIKPHSDHEGGTIWKLSFDEHGVLKLSRYNGNDVLPSVDVIRELLARE